MAPIAVAAFAAACTFTFAACGRPVKKSEAPNSTSSSATADHVPVPINPVSPVEYPPALLAEKIEGRVLLRLHVDSTGNLLPDSSRVAESSGYPALDSAALAGARGLQFSPALHGGRPIGLSFIQPVLFRFPRVRGATP
jgi:TonB family protein